MISSEPLNILLPNLVWWCRKMSQSVKRNKNCLLSSKSRSQRGLIWSKYYSDYYIFWTADSLVTKLGLMIGYRRQERPVETLDYCIQGQGHSEGSKSLCSSRWYLLNRPTFCYQAWYCDASSWAGVSCKKIRFLFSRSRSQQGLVWSKYDSFYYIFLIADPCATKLGFIVHYHKPECLTKKLDCCV